MISKMVPTLKKSERMKITAKIVVKILLCSGALKVTRLQQNRTMNVKQR